LVELRFDPYEIALEDEAIAEEIAGGPLEELFSGGMTGAKSKKARYYLVMRQNDPDFTVEKLKTVNQRDFLALSEALAVIVPDPTEEGVGGS